MTDDLRRIQADEEVVKRLLAAMRSSLKEAIDRSHAYDDHLVIGIVEDELIVGNTPVMRTSGVGEAMQRLRAAGVERITIDRGATPEEVNALVVMLAEVQATGEKASSAASAGSLGSYIRLGRLQVQRRFETVEVDCASIQRQYRESVAQAEVLLEEARLNGTPDPGKAQAIVSGMAQALAQNRTAVLALTAMKYYDNYTFTHLVNVAVLTMAQARSMGIEGRLLRDFGLAGFLHDIGKILVPREILTKTERLTEQEFAIIRRHPVDGAKILRRRREIPTLAAAVAFEHHVRIDGAGYPAITRPLLNLATQMCSIADTYDAMRSKRAYQSAFPTDRILAVLEHNDGQQFDQHLVRRFCQLMGIYPPGSLVRLDSGEVAVVVRPHAEAPRRPAVRVVTNADGERLDTPIDIALWAGDGTPWAPPSIASLVDPADVDFDPLSFLDKPAA
jgi:putative nucleotidyltransferase with HDIG domain